LKDRLDAFLSHRIERWVEAIQPRASLVAWLSVAITVALGVYTAFGLGINSDNVRLLADTLQAKIAYKEFSRFFPNLDDALLVVIDADSAEQAREATDELTRVLAEHRDSFTAVYVPDGGAFFERNGLLYRTPEELYQFADQMARLQPLLELLEADPSIESLARIIRLGLDVVSKEGGSEAEWSPLLERVGDATVTVFDESPVAVSWEEVLLGGSSPQENRRGVVVAHPVLDFDNVLAAGRAMRVIRDVAEKLGYTPEQGVRVRITGNPALNYEEMIGLAWDIGGSSVFCFLIVCAVIWRALRSFKLMLASVATLLMGLVWTAAFATLAVGQLNILSLTFAVLFIGLGIDFAIHLGVRYVHLLRQGLVPDRAMAAAAGQVGSSLVICTFTTAIGFFVFLPSEYRGIAELGLIAGVGMFVILALSLTTLPALLQSWLRFDPARALKSDVHFDAAWLHGLAAHGRLIRWISLALGLASLVFIIYPGAHFDTNVIRMRDAQTESVQAFEDLMAATMTSPWYANSVASDLAEADQVATRMRALEPVARAITLSDYVPTNQQEKLEILSDVARLLGVAPSGPKGAPASAPSVEQQVEALRDLTAFLSQGWVNAAQSPLGESMRVLRQQLLEFLARIDADADPGDELERLQKVLFSRLPAQIERLRLAVSPEEITLEDLPPELSARMLAPTGQARVQIFPRENLQDNIALDRFVTAIRGVDPMVSGVSLNLYDFGRATVSSFQEALSLALVLIAATLYLLWRNVKDVLLVLAPLVLGGLTTVAAMAALDIHFNFANVVVLPLLLGVGVDSGIHLVHRAKMRISKDEFLLGTTTARAVYYSALTTIVSFGTLVFSSHRGVASLGILLTIGMVVTVAYNLIALPALIELRERDAGADYDTG